MCSVLRYLTDMTDSHFPLGQKLCVAMFTSLYPCNYFVANVGVVYSFLYVEMHVLHKITYHFDTFNRALYIDVKMQHKLNYSFL